MIGIILAAGRGLRLGKDIDLTKVGPKCLLTVNGYTLLERMVADLASFDVDTIKIVVGYNADAVEGARSKLESKYGVDLILAYNNEFLSTNTAYSLNIGISGVDDDVVIFNGDLLYDYAILSDLLSINQTAIVVDDKKTLTEESFKLRIVNGQIEEIGKFIPINEATGEFIGISKIARGDVEEAKRLLRYRIASDPNSYYDEIYKPLSKDGRFAYSFTNGLKWTEIDDIHDLIYAKSIASVSDSTRRHLG
ncbi:phosphocholine cytidylyltransferase family protein [Methanoculleus thermophilus]|nr:phosphocholine cytidylyltransferase family protein [Methanoculleus thermophilus]